MSDKTLTGEHELKLGASFSNNKASQYHTIKYDFKPASVDVNKMATVDVGTSNQVSVTVPHLDGSGVPQTVFKGNQRPYAKECVLIIDRVTGEITLEKLSSNIQVKKTRQESTIKPRPLTPVELTNTTQRSSSRTRVTSGVSRRINPVNSAVRYSGAPHKTPPMLVRSPPRVKTSPPQAAPWMAGGHSTLASLPMIGLDEAPEQNGYAAPPGPAPAPAPAAPPPPAARPTHDRGFAAALPSLNTQQPASSAEQSSSSSSSDSGSGSDSDSDSDDAQRGQTQTDISLTNGVSHAVSQQPPLLSDVLNDDLCLSESGSESD